MIVCILIARGFLVTNLLTKSNYMLNNAKIIEAICANEERTVLLKLLFIVLFLSLTITYISEAETMLD